MMASTRGVHAFVHQLAEVNRRFVPSGSLVPRASRAQYLFDGFSQPVRVAEHKAVELLLLRFGQFAALQSFQMKADRSNRGFQFVSDRIDKAVVLLAAAYLANQEAGVH